MSDSRSVLSPRQAECLRLVWDRQATSKEIALELGIAKTTVDSHIAEAVQLLGARDRRDAARIAWGDDPRAGSGADPAPVPTVHIPAAEVPRSTSGLLPRPWRSEQQPRNMMTPGQTLGSIAMIILGSLIALSLSASIGAGMPAIWRPVLIALRRLTH